MKRVFTLLAALFILGSGYQAQAYADLADYTIDDAAVEATLNAAIDMVSLNLSQTAEDLPAKNGGPVLRAEDPDPVVAWLLTAVGAFGIHRVYLGAKPSMIAIYIFTCFGIVGIVPLVDSVVLLIGLVNDDISKYVDNQKFLMW